MQQVVSFFGSAGWCAPQAHLWLRLLVLAHLFLVADGLDSISPVKKWW
jgi:hypothetical protein